MTGLLRKRQRQHQLTRRQEIETWVQAIAHYDNNEFEAALSVFSNIADTSKILFNCGVIHATIGEHDRAVRQILDVKRKQETNGQ